MGDRTQDNWYWIGKYLIVIVAALALGSVLASLDPFKGTMLGSTRIGAGTLVQFLAQSGALALLWALGHRHAAQLRRGSGPGASLAASVLAIITLVVVASAYEVLLHFLAPLLSPEQKSAIDWTFIVGILAAALWLVWVLFRDAEPLIEALGRVARGKRTAAAPRDGQPAK